MSKQSSATLPLESKERKAKEKKNVITVKLFKRNNSCYWQARVQFGDEKPRRITTRTLSPAAAAEFAELLYRHEARQRRVSPPELRQPEHELFGEPPRHEDTKKENQP